MCTHRLKLSLQNFLSILKETAMAGVDEVNALFHPKSKFYTDLEKIMSLFCHQRRVDG